MKTVLRDLFARVLGMLAGAIIRKYKPRIIMLTGSVGKTSTKDATAAVFSECFHLRASEKSYNSMFGVPLTVIGALSPWKNSLGWFRVIEEGLALLIFPNHYPKLLILEVGADRPGDLSKILSITDPDAVIVTHLSDVPVHVEAYASPQAVRDEEFTPARALAPHEPLIINADDPHALQMAKSVRAKHTTIGFSDNADLRILDAQAFFEEGEPVGMRAIFSIAGVSYPYTLRGALGRSQLYAPAGAFAAALALNLSPSEALSGLSRYLPPPGRGRLLKGMRDSLVIDDSYNASPVAVKEALEALCFLNKKHRRIAVLGDMLELGRYSAKEHAQIGKIAASCADLLVVVGIRARAIGEAAKEAGMAGTTILEFDTSTKAAGELKSLIEKGDAVLVKGSQSMRMERIVRELLANPDDAEKLVRQEPEWQKTV